jgi:hypothetical protein
MCNISGSVANCAVENEQYKLDYPDAMFGWFCMSEKQWLILGELLQRCEQNDSLPHNDNTFERLLFYTCPDDRIEDGYTCTDEKGYNKLKAKIDWCRSQKSDRT